MRRFLILLTAVFAAFLPTTAGARTETIASVVNDEAISMSDVNDRMMLIILSSGLSDTDEIRARLTGQVLTALIEEQIMLQEAARLDLAVEREEIDQGFATIAAQNNFTPEKFRALLQQNGINIATMERQIKSQIAWSKVIQAKLRPKVTISDQDIDDVLERLNNNKGASEFLAAEIFLPVEDPKDENDTRQLAGRLIGEIKSGKAPFFKVAQQFSKAAGAAQGGDLGWVRQGQLSEEIDEVLLTMQKEQISDPVRSAGGYHILFLRDKRQITEETIPSRDEIMTSLGIQRLERMQRRYLLDLKAAAFIENRV